MKDALGDRMKDYEVRSKTYLPRRTYTLIRIDGKAFHTFTKGFKKPYDMDLINAMDYTTKMLCSEIQGCKLGYTQSDEISLLLTDFDKIGTDAYFDGSVQKITSITASMATAFFNDYMRENGITDKLAFFDSRVYIITEGVEVENYFIWRQQDCVRNSISMTAQSLYSHNELNGVNTTKMQDLCIEKGVNWNDLPAGFKRGRMIWKENYETEIDTEKFSGLVTRSRWAINPAIWITKERPKFSRLIPRRKVDIGEAELESLINKYGPEGLYDIAKKLMQYADADVNSAIQQPYEFNYKNK